MSSLQASKEPNKDAFMGDILAYEGKFKEAGKMYQKAGCSHKALSMYTDMRMFDLAQVSGIVLVEFLLVLPLIIHLFLFPS